MEAGPLNGIKVLDMSRILAGPWAGQLLADYGADVIKVERPGSGDDTRHWGPPWVKNADEADAVGDAAYFHATNRNKRSITIDLRMPAGQKILKELAGQCDVVIENFKVGDLKRFGLDGVSLCNSNPFLIYCSISSYGQSGSRSLRPGYDAMIQASAGLMSVTGDPASENGKPQKVGVAIADIMAGMYAATAILAALNERARTGKGQRIDVPLYDSQVAWLANQNMNFLFTGASPERMGTGHPNIVPYQVFATRDTYLMLAVGNDRQFRSCAECLGIPEIADDDRFSTNADRVRNRLDLVKTVAEILQTETTNHWLSLFSARNVPAGPVNSIDTVLGNDYAKERELVRQINHPVIGDVPTVANPVEFSSSVNRYEFAPPLLGEHTADILTNELGYSPDEVDRLKKTGVV